MIMKYLASLAHILKRKIKVNVMKIKIHRGTHQIGGCVTEYEYNGYRLFVDYGEELPGGPRRVRYKSKV